MELSDSILHTRSMILAGAGSETEVARLRDAWAREAKVNLGPDMGGVTKISEKGAAKMNAVSNKWLEGQVARVLDELDIQREEARKAEAARAKTRIREKNETLRLQLGAKFLKNVEVDINNGFACFSFRGDDYCVQQDDNSKQFFLNQQPVMNVPGDLGDKILASLVALVDAKRNPVSQ